MEQFTKQPEIFKKVEVFTIYDYEWEEFVKENYEAEEYCYDCAEETGHDDVKVFHITKKEELATWEKKALEDLKIGKDPSTYIILQDLCNRDILQLGYYQITTV